MFGSSHKNLNQALHTESKSINKDELNNLISICFGEDSELAQDLKLYLAELEEKDELLEFKEALDSIQRYREDKKRYLMYMKEEPATPLKQLFLRFLESLSPWISENTEDGRGCMDPKILRIAANFYKKYRSEFNGELKDKEGLANCFSLDIMVNFQHQLMEMFGKLGYDFNVRHSGYGNTPLLSLISNSYNEEAFFLLMLTDKYSEKKLDVNIRSSIFGTNALHLAVAKGYRDHNAYGEFIRMSNLTLVQKLIEHGADLDLGMETNNPEANGLTALHLAAARKDMEFCKLLIKHGADILIKNASGKTPLDLLFLSDKEAQSLIGVCTGEQSIFRKYQPSDPSPETLKADLIEYAKKIDNEQVENFSWTKKPY